MKHLIYGLTSTLLTDDVAYGLLEYAAALAQAQLTDHVELPASDDDGAPTTVVLLLTPNLPILLREAPDTAPEVDFTDDAEGARMLDELKRRTHALQTTGTR
ncbi:hypothetical protein HUN58_02110 [Curtobacterium sp. Csp1]|uniref:hypothetical protein n=1 Tax=Curtobacterium sp. Csp1 TaxID=2495429 RepID=UPI0015971CD1|nr:hypothetical protein [Curtobacterium sp. Csp1]QKS18855.1 hypothetical protein HUN58_02110 [Curtobacterium sp. Csp1]